MKANISKYTFVIVLFMIEVVGYGYKYAHLMKMICTIRILSQEFEFCPFHSHFAKMGSGCGRESNPTEDPEDTPHPLIIIGAVAPTVENVPPSSLDIHFDDLVQKAITADGELVLIKGCSIPETEKRAISLEQLDRITSHFTRRLAGGEEWKVNAQEKKLIETLLTDPAQATLYDVCQHVMYPATEPRKLSLVEVMSEGEQPPDFFVSHWSLTLPNFSPRSCVCT